MPKRNNPQTSKDAHASLKQEEIREMYRRILEALRLIKEGHMEDIAACCKVKPEKVWKRLSEMKVMGLIYRPGNRKLLASGCTGYTWRLIDNDQPTVPVTEKALPGPRLVILARNLFLLSLNYFKMSRIQAPLILPKHPELLRKINQMCIDIKVHYLIKNQDAESMSKLAQAQLQHDKPLWEDVIDILDKCRTAINEQREDPRKY